MSSGGSSVFIHLPHRCRVAVSLVIACQALLVGRKVTIISALVSVFLKNVLFPNTETEPNTYTYMSTPYTLTLTFYRRNDEWREL